ncbi:DNA-3-methyladenine glycosylase I [Flavobacterium frigoris]|uniref:DNA-3-methyladenine glycosylase I n=1 Tax=Flavobacterium frigoris (strain PS1) TaxID=1086011 RepID=H7FQ09_FLAFP|nr:DNA-3-methyladenine glycosylase I [Flavobacterium frigoris]EIA09363.1 DNA-3-methyladenine glycosylase [Flavobacterium frigoris PS1]
MENKTRCGWCLSSDLYKEYHDQEWGTPVYDDATLFEFLILETFQAGLSWITILNKRENFRIAFDNFDYKIIAKYSEEKIQALLLDTGIIRNKLKVRSAVSNSIAFMEIQQEFGSFSSYIWNFTDGQPVINNPKTLKDVPATTPLSDEISKDLKKRGFKFVGSTVMYAHMQATGMVNDHIEDCWKMTALLNS